MSRLSIKQTGKLIISSLKGEEHDYTSGSLKTAVVLLAIPMILEMMMESVFAVVDIFFVNRLGADATSVVGLTESVITIVYSIGIGLSAAATAMVARRIGEKNRQAAADAGRQAILLSLIATVVVSIPGVIFAETILGWMGAEPSAIASGSGYTRILFGSSVTIILLFMINGIFRGAGNAAIAMKSLWLANLLNIILDPLLIFGIGPSPELGLKGAAIATAIGRGCGVAYQLYHLVYGTKAIRISLFPLSPDLKIISSLTRIASPATLQFLIGSASWIVLAALVAQYGSEASAGYQTAIRILIFFILPAWGLSNAAATLVGQNLGAAQPLRAERSVALTAKYNTWFMLGVTILFLTLGGPILGFFIADGETLQFNYALNALRIMSVGYVFYGIGMVLTQAFNGAGDTRTPTLINLFCFWTFQIPVAFLLARGLHWEANGVFTAIPLAETMIALVSILVFRRGKWKNVQV
jgi:putative MATE family efflux protein